MNKAISKHNDLDKDALIAEFQAVLADAEELLHATASQGGDKMAAIRTKMIARLSEAKNSLIAAEQRLMEKTRAAAKATDEYVRENPWQSALIAGGIGIMIGFIAHRLVASPK